MKKVIFLFLMCSIVSFGQQTYNIIPKPTKITPQSGVFTLTDKAKILIPQGNTEINAIAELLSERVMVSSGFQLNIESYDPNKSGILPNGIVFSLEKNSKIPEEGYTINVSKSSISIMASTTKGLFYGYQTLLQILPTNIYSSSTSPNTKWTIPCGIINDAPRYTYRGLMLDVGRHFYTTDYIKKFIDIMAMHKFNQFHWHLTEDQGWRIEIKKYPQLTAVGSKRKQTMEGHYSEQRYDGTPYGGYYTQEEIKEVIRYAQSKYVNVIPEIEMPGHALAALAAYPELGCKGSGYEVTGTWGVHDDVFCPFDKTFEFLENVLTEVIDLFPSKYIHIGGDECPKTTWKESKFCQDLMKKEGLKDEHELQSYFIKRIDKFITSKGRKMIGWDEILEGGISPNATIMSWRGIEGGVAAAKQNHNAIMTPTSHCYLDYYQSDPTSEPLAIGGYLPLEKVYSYEPMPKELSAEQAKHILGVQGNIWTEYIKTPDKLEYMAFPRATAIAEIGWSQPEQKSFADFSSRLKVQFERMQNMGINFAKSYYDISASSSLNAKSQVAVKLKTTDSQALIKYTVDGTEPTAKSLVYNPNLGVILTKDATIRSAAFNDKGEKLGKILDKYFFINKSTGKTYKMVNEPLKYTGGEKYGLTNGVRGEEKNMSTWVGLDGKDLDVTLDLGQTMEVCRVMMAFLRASNSWILYPKMVEIQTSVDGKKFETAQKIDIDNSIRPENAVQQINTGLGSKKARFIRVFAQNYGKLPEGHPGAGRPAWLFVDEIGIE